MYVKSCEALYTNMTQAAMHTINSVISYSTECIELKVHIMYIYMQGLSQLFTDIHLYFAPTYKITSNNNLSLKNFIN